MIAERHRGPFYVLKRGVVTASNWTEWAVFLGMKKQRAIALTKWRGVIVETWFIGFDESLGEQKPPLLYKTFVFRGKPVKDLERDYATKEEALAGHKLAVRIVKGKK